VQPRGPWQRPTLTGDLDDDAVLALNNANATETSQLTLEALRSQAFFAAGVDAVAADARRNASPGVVRGARAR
jgi:hypothetical protein